MQEMSWLRSSSVCLRARAGLPRPHRGAPKLRAGTELVRAACASRPATRGPRARPGEQGLPDRLGVRGRGLERPRGAGARAVLAPMSRGQTQRREQSLSFLRIQTLRSSMPSHVPCLVKVCETDPPVGDRARRAPTWRRRAGCCWRTRWTRRRSGAGLRPSCPRRRPAPARSSRPRNRW